jgi:4-hydroxybutyrate CoA-transferase
MPSGASSISADGRGSSWPGAISASGAAALVRDGDHIVTSGCGAAPLEFLAALAARKDLAAAYVSHATAWGILPYLAEDSRPAHLRMHAYFLPPLARKLHRQGEVDYVPLTFSNMGSMYSAEDLAADVVAVTCSMPDGEGFCSLGPFVSYLPAAMKRARVVIGERSPQWPRTKGAARVHVATFHHFIDVARAPITSPPVEDQAEARGIAEHILGLVPDGATIQIGRGAIPNAVATGLAQRSDLGVHSEMLSDWVVDLYESGAISGSRKVNHPGRIVTSFMDGSSRLYEFAGENEALLMQPIYEVNDPATIGAESNFIAINSAVEIDLTGQINAESIGDRLISGSGGLLDFAVGAARSPGGKFIVAMPSTAKGGTVSRIVATLASGAAVTVPRALAHYVITEHGVANLRGCTLEERAKRLIAIADPRFRDELGEALVARNSRVS